MKRVDQGLRQTNRHKRFAAGCLAIQVQGVSLFPQRIVVTHLVHVFEEVQTVQIRATVVQRFWLRPLSFL